MPAGYRELAELGHGGFGRVVLARHETTGTLVAIKYLSMEAFGSDTLREQFREEARLMMSVSGPHIARFYEFSETEQGAVIVMEAVNGVSLRRLLDDQGPTTPEAALTVLKGSLLGLAAAHDAGVVHRDYKPTNVLVQENGVSKLIDFGIAARAAGPALPAGTPAYTAPEQWTGAPATPAGDVYAATCVFYECITGRTPFTAKDAGALRQAHATAPIPLGDLPEALRPLLARGMAKNPADRPAEAAAFVGELDAIATTAYGPDWQTIGLRHLIEAAAGLIAVLPLAIVAAAGGGAAWSSIGHATTVVGHAARKGLLGGKITAAKATLVMSGAIVVGVTAIALVVTPHGHKKAARRTPTPTPVASVVPAADVHSCPGLDALGNPFKGTVPPRVQLPSGLTLPPGAVVHGAAMEGSGPYYLVGPAGGSCALSQGADGGTQLTVDAPDRKSAIQVTYSAGGAAISMSWACGYFPELAKDPGGGQPFSPCERLPGTGRFTRLSTGTDGFYAGTEFRAPPRENEHGVGVVVGFADRHHIPFQSIFCDLPHAQAQVCTAALDYFLVQAAEDAGVKAPDLMRMRDAVNRFVAANM